MAKTRIKTLILCHKDTPYAGHGYYDYLNLPDKLFDKRVVVLSSINNNDEISLYRDNSIKFKIHRRLKKYLFNLKMFVKSGSILKLPTNNSLYCYENDNITESASSILNKIKGFNPDLILVYWVSYFVNVKTIYELKQITKAHICFSMTDESLITGGCHYPVECKEYLNKCTNCPALVSGKYSSELALQEKKYYLSKLGNFSITGTQYDCNKAKECPHLKNAHYLPNTVIPNVEVYDKKQARDKFGVKNENFVILLASSELYALRKGAKYGFAAIDKFIKDKENVSIILLGNKIDYSFENPNSCQIIKPGFVNFSDMMAAFCASDVFLSPTIADSGPMMVNYSVLLGVPVVSFEVGIADTLVENGVTGYKYKEISSASLCEGLNELYKSNSKDFVTMQQNCINKMRPNKNQSQWYESLYDYMTENIL